ncbi:OstA-like protein [Palleniella intestinalis]|uniref:OstA-like protein n=1 Tax=Palleniella intestinalis TaxID=2736291 RepID=UPI0020A66F80|nr:OstA-like protein [Palleniella intestinalis]
MNRNIHNIFGGHRVIMLIALCFFVIGAIVGASGPKKRGRAKKNSTDTRVYLQHANEFSYDMYGKHPDAQFVKGNVSFLHKGIVLTCDSALYFQQTNSFEAFGHVKMRQGDTLTLTSDYAYYDGNDEMAEVRHNVILTHRKTKLYCDSLNYDRIYSIGYFFEGGKLVDGETTLTSDWGQYSTADKQAVFYYDVRLKNKTSLTEGDTLYYDTRTSRAHVVGPSKITTKEDVIITEDGYYNSKNDQMELYSRSTINRNDGKVITADSLQHNSNTGISECFGNVEFDDSINKSAFRGDYVYYDENKGYGLATKRAIAMDYSQGDTLYLHGDTMRLFTYNINTDSVYRVMQCSPHVRAYRKDVQAVCDSMVMLSRDSVLIMYKDPILWSDGRQIVGEEIRAYMADSTIRFAHVIGQAFSIEQMPDTVHYNQISSKEMKTYFTDGRLRLNQAEGNVLTLYYAEDSADSTLIGLNYLETDTMRMYFTPARKMDKIWACKHNGVMYPISQIPPDKYFLPGFAWFDYVRPLSKDDILEWRPKKEGMELKKEKRRQAPRNTVATLQKN